MSIICIFDTPDNLPGNLIGISLILYFFERRKMLSQKKE